MPQSKEAHREYMRLWRIGRPVSIKEYRNIYKGRYCHVCGYSRVVDGHHLDGNHDNDEETNLLDLCPNCHALVTRRLASLNELLEEGDYVVEGV